MHPVRRRLNLAFAAVAALAAVTGMPAHGQAWPSRQVTLVNNFPPGGPSDILARGVAAVLQEQFKQPFVVDNKAGAGGNLGAGLVAKAPADGHTLLVGIDSAFTVNPHLYPSMPFKPGELKPVVIMASSGLLIGMSQASGIRNMGDLLSQGRKRTLNFSNGGNGSPGHLASAVLSSTTPVKIAAVPYKGNSPAVTAVLSGEVDGGILATPGMLPHIGAGSAAGKIVPLAVTSARHSQLAPQLPTVAELGLKALESEVLYLVMAPAATPDAVLQPLARAITDALQRPELQARMKGLDLFHEGQTGAAAARRLADLNARYGELVRSTGMKAE
jgi:tripartite-type tricarboxylate transporter receptor subunit TctC